MKTNNLIVSRALTFATKAHSGAVRKGTDIPYIVHPMEAALIVSGITSDPELIAAALLHDTVEDTDTTIKNIRDEFGERVANLVADETENKRENQCSRETWRIRKQETLTHLANASADAKTVALGDKLANMRAICRDYNEIGDNLWERFNTNNPADQAWYYGSLAETLSELSCTAAWQEYKELVDTVFGKYRG